MNLSANKGILSKEEYKRLDDKWSATVSKFQDKAAATPYGIPLYDVPTVFTICEELGIKAECWMDKAGGAHRLPSHKPRGCSCMEQ